MRSVTFVTITLFGVVAAGWNRFHGHSEHHFEPKHFGPNDESFHFGRHVSHREPHFEPPHKHPHFTPPHESPYHSPHHESSYFKPPHETSHSRPPYGSPHFGHPQKHHEYHFEPPHHPHIQPPWVRPDWNRPGPGVNYHNDGSSFTSSSSEEYYDDDQGPPRNSHTAAQWTTRAAVPTTTETSGSIWNKPSSHGNRNNPWFPTFTIHKGSLLNPSRTSTVSKPNSSIMEDCVTSCKQRLTSEYNPVCGTNNVTYQNIGLLLCTKGCGVDVELKRKFGCPKNNGITPEHIVDTTQSTVGNDKTTDTTQLTTGGWSEMTQGIQNCMHTCPFNGEFSPVCGTDLNTYFNHDRFLCAKKCGVDVELKCRFPCSTSNCHTVETTTTTATTTISTTKSINLAKSTPPRPSLQHCLLTCAATAEYNPVCGTNNITYDNPSKLLCAQLCGVDVSLKHQFICRTTAPSTPPTPVTTASTTLPPFTVACMRGCTVTQEYNPVCGTNHVTYTNPGTLDCAKLCGVDVEILINSPCKITNANDFTQTTQQPRHGNGVTEPRATSSGFTINQSLLDSIFSKNPTTQTVPTTDEVFNIDIRYNKL